MADHDSSIEQARRHLMEAQSLLHAELGDYPTPIAGCDAQYTHLLGERRRVRDALAVLEAPMFLPTPRQLEMNDRIESR